MSEQKTYEPHIKRILFAFVKYAWWIFFNYNTDTGKYSNTEMLRRVTFGRLSLHFTATLSVLSLGVRRCLKKSDTWGHKVTDENDPPPSLNVEAEVAAEAETTKKTSTKKTPWDLKCAHIISQFHDPAGIRILLFQRHKPVVYPLHHR